MYEIVNSDGNTYVVVQSEKSLARRAVVALCTAGFGLFRVLVFVALGLVLLVIGGAGEALKYCIPAGLECLSLAGLRRG